MKTVSEVLNTCKVDDILSDGVRTWKVTDVDMDGVIVAQPYKWNKSKMGSSFEIWSHGVESIAIIPKLKRLKN